MTAMSVDDWDAGRRFVVGTDLLGGRRVVEGGTEDVDRALLEVEPYVGVDGCGDADAGVAEEFLDHDKLDALFQEQGDGGVPEGVEADAAEASLAEECGEGPG